MKESRYYFNSNSLKEDAPLLRPQSRVITQFDETIEAQAREKNTSHPCISYFLSPEEISKRFPKAFS